MPQSNVKKVPHGHVPIPPVASAQPPAASAQPAVHKFAICHMEKFEKRLEKHQRSSNHRHHVAIPSLVGTVQLRFCLFHPPFPLAGRAILQITVALEIAL